MRVHHRAAAVAVDRAQVQVQLRGRRQRPVDLAAVQRRPRSRRPASSSASTAPVGVTATWSPAALADVAGGAQDQPLRGQTPRDDGHLLACLPDAHGGNVPDPVPNAKREFTFWATWVYDADRDAPLLHIRQQSAHDLRREPQQARSRARLAGLLDAAEALLVREGPEALTTTRIADEAGVSVGSLYRWFPDKAAIVDALTRRYLAEFEATIDELAAGRPHRRVGRPGGNAAGRVRPPRRVPARLPRAVAGPPVQRGAAAPPTARTRRSWPTASAGSWSARHDRRQRGGRHRLPRRRAGRRRPAARGLPPGRRRRPGADGRGASSCFAPTFVLPQRSLSPTLPQP